MKKLAHDIIDSDSRNDRLNHCIDVLFENYEIDYDLLITTIDLIVQEAYDAGFKEQMTLLKAERLAKKNAAKQEKIERREREKAHYAALRVKNLGEVLEIENLDKGLIEDALSDPLLSIALRAMNKDA